MTVTRSDKLCGQAYRTLRDCYYLSPHWLPYTGSGTNRGMTRSKRTKRTPEVAAYLGQLPIALYVRFSVNPDGTNDSTTTQIKVGKAWCNDRWPGRKVIVYEDDGITASREDVVRPEFERMLADIEAGKVGDVAARWQARISRSELTWPRFKDVCLGVGIETLSTWIEGDIAMAPGKSLGGDVGNLMHSHTSAAMKVALNEALDLRAQEGRPSGGRCYGYRHVRDGREVKLEIRDGEADVIREVAAMLIDGYSLADIARELNRRDVPTPRGGKAWKGDSVRAIVTKESVAGLRVQNGVVTAKGTWTAILDEDTWNAVRAILNAPRTITRNDGRTYTRKVGRVASRAYLLSGEFSLCSRCANAGGLSAMTHYPKKGAPLPMYSCLSKNGGCNGVGIFAEPLEDHVNLVVAMRLMNRKHLRKLIDRDDVDATKRQRLENAKATALAVLDEAADDRANGDLDRDGYNSAAAKCKKRIADLDEQIGKLIVPKALMDWEDVRDQWAGMPVPMKRNVMRRMGLTVELFPATGPRVSNPAGRTRIYFDGVPWAPEVTDRAA